MALLGGQQVGIAAIHQHADGAGGRWIAQRPACWSPRFRGKHAAAWTRAASGLVMFGILFLPAAPRGRRKISRVEAACIRNCFVFVTGYDAVRRSLSASRRILPKDETFRLFCTTLRTLASAWGNCRCSVMRLSQHPAMRIVSGLKLPVSADRGGFRNCVIGRCPTIQQP